MSEPQLPVFVYGNLQPGQSNFFRLAKHATRTEPAVMPALLLTPVPHDPNPHATAGRPGDQVHGFLVWLADTPGHTYDQTLADLDSYQDYDPENYLSSERLRLPRLAIVEATGETVHAWVYLTATRLLAANARPPRR